MRKAANVLLLVLGLLTLVACDSAEERAEKHYQSALTLLAEGDEDRALVELRNVFDLAPGHREARRLYADTVLGRGNVSEGYGQYLRLVEQYPDDFKARVTLARLAVGLRNWPEVDRHLDSALELSPEDPEVQALDAARTYRKAALDEDESLRAQMATRVRELIAQRPEDLILREVSIDDHIRMARYEEALAEIGATLEFEPENRGLYNLRLGILNDLGDISGMEQELRDMIVRFPEDEVLKTSLIRFFTSRGELDKAEAFLREISDPAAEDTERYVLLIQFLAQTRGVDAAVEAADAAVAANPNPDLFRGIKASLLFDSGRRDEGIALMQQVTEGAEETAQTYRFRVVLAKMLAATGNEVGARKLVEEVLSKDATNIEALKMQAAWLIDGDRTDEAIEALRTALDGAPQDFEAMSLMARAHARNGNRNLARDMLSLAVEASNSAPDETLRYVQVLVSEESYRPAEDALLAALRLSPRHVGLLSALGNVYLRLDDASRARQVEESLRRIDTPEALAAADGMRVALLTSTGQQEQALGFLETLAAGDDETAARAKIAILRSRLVAGDSQKALEYAEQIRREDPDNLAFRYAYAATLAANGNLDTAEAEYRALLEDDPAAGRVWLELARVMRGKGDDAAAREAVVKGLEAVPFDPNLLWAEASYREGSGDIAGALEIYETLYERMSDNLIVANNLASLLVTQADDPETVQRAFAVARRLRGTDVPAFQDTYGWILYKLGQHEEALDYLKPAAEALTEDPLVQVHLGMAYLTLGQAELAREQLQKAVALAGPIDQRPEIEKARAELARLREAAGQD